MSFFSSFPLLSKTIALSSLSKPLFSPSTLLAIKQTLYIVPCHVFIITIIKAHLMQEVSCVYRSRFVHVTVVSLSSVVSTCLLNLSRSLLFLSLSSLVAMLHHVFWLSVFAAYSLLHVTLVYPGVGFPCSPRCSHRGFLCTRRSYDSRMMTTQCGAFRVRNVSFRARDAPTSLVSTTDQCGARSGSPQSSNKFTPSHYKLNSDNYNYMRSLLHEIDWYTMNDMTSEEAWEFFFDNFNAIIENTVPKSNNKVKYKNVYINKEAMKIRKRKLAFWRQYCSTLDPIDYVRFAKERNRLRSFTRKLRYDYEALLANGMRDNPKAFWHYIKSKLKTRVSVESLHLEDGSIAIMDQDKADVLNIYFCSVFTKEDLANIPVINDIYPSSPIIDIPLPGEAIYKKLSQLDPSKSPSPDGWHPRFIKEAAEQLVTPLQILFRKFYSGFIPKTANVISIFKKGSHKLPSNYRPISLTSVICKVLESLIRDAVIDYLYSQMVYLLRNSMALRLGDPVLHSYLLPWKAGLLYFRTLLTSGEFQSNYQIKTTK